MTILKYYPTFVFSNLTCVDKALVIIPTYNEKGKYCKDGACHLSASRLYDILIVDDGSPDGTA